MAKVLFYIFLFSLVGIATIQLAAGIREQRAEAMHPADGELVTVDGAKIHVQVFGEGPDLVLLHGASGNARDFTFQLIPALQDRYRIIAMDRPGLGWSTNVDGHGGLLATEGESPKLQARLLREAAEQVGVSNPLVLGHSFGGAVALAWVLDDPDAAGLITVAGVSHPWPGELHWQYPLNASLPGGAFVVPLVSAFAPRALVDSTVAGIFAPQAVPEGYTAHIGATMPLRRKALRTNARQVNGLRPHIVEMAPKYPDLTIPIEIVHGDADTIVPLDVHGIPLSERVKSANLTVLSGVGHMPHHTNMAEVIAAIDRAAERAGLR